MPSWWPCVPSYHDAPRYLLPWAEVVVDFHDRIKNLTSGYASFNYTEAAPRPSRLVKVDVSVNGEVVDALSFVSPAADAQVRGRRACARLQRVVARQQFEIIIQAKVGIKPLARERIQPFRKDVLVKSGKMVRFCCPAYCESVVDSKASCWEWALVINCRCSSTACLILMCRLLRRWVAGT
jgi:hypothetical protein